MSPPKVCLRYIPLLVLERKLVLRLGNFQPNRLELEGRLLGGSSVRMATFITSELADVVVVSVIPSST